MEITKELKRYYTSVAMTSIESEIKEAIEKRAKEVAAEIMKTAKIDMVFRETGTNEDILVLKIKLDTD